MYSSFYYFFIIFTIIIFISICSVTAYSSIDNIVFYHENKSYTLSSDFLWPIPGFTKITSPFGKRIAPTSRCF